MSRPQHSGWTMNEVITLREMWDGRYETVIAISEKLGRSTYSVGSQALARGLSLTYVWRDWSEEELRDLREAWAAGRTLNEIADLLGRSRSSIAGKVRRLDLERRGSPIKLPTGKRAGRKAPVVPMRRMFAPEPDAAGVFGPDMSRDACRYPLWGEDVISHMYCGKTRLYGRSYCQEHFDRCYRKPEPAGGAA